MSVNVENTGYIRYAYNILVSTPSKRKPARQYGRGCGKKEISCKHQSQALDFANDRVFFQGENRNGRPSRNIGKSAKQRYITSQKSADPIRPRSKSKITQGVSSLRVYQLLNEEKINTSELRVQVHARTMSISVLLERTPKGTEIMYTVYGDKLAIGKVMARD
jgi:hypothetical protein